MPVMSHVKKLEDIETKAALVIQKWVRDKKTKTQKFKDEIKEMGAEVLNSISSEKELYAALEKSMMQSYLLFNVVLKLEQKKKKKKSQ